MELKQKDEERKAQEALELASNRSKDSFQSKEIYSENGEGGEEQEMECKRDNFMKDIEKEMAKLLRIKDFSKEVSHLKVKGEADRMKLMARMVMMKRRAEDEAQLKRLEAEHKDDGKLRVRRAPSPHANPLAEDLQSARNSRTGRFGMTLAKTEVFDAGGHEINSNGSLFDNQRDGRGKNMMHDGPKGINMNEEQADLRSESRAGVDEPEMPIAVTDLRSATKSREDDDDDDDDLGGDIFGRSLHKLDSAKSGLLNSDAASNAFFEAFKAEQKKASQESLAEEYDDETEEEFKAVSMEGYVRGSEQQTDGRQVTLQSSDQQRPVPQITRLLTQTEKLQDYVNDQNVEDSVMLHQLQKMMQKIKFHEIQSKQQAGE